MNGDVALVALGAIVEWLEALPPGQREAFEAELVESELEILRAMEKKLSGTRAKRRREKRFNGNKTLRQAG